MCSLSNAFQPVYYHIGNNSLENLSMHATLRQIQKGVRVARRRANSELTTRNEPKHATRFTNQLGKTPLCNISASIKWQEKIASPHERMDHAYSTSSTNRVAAQGDIQFGEAMIFTYNNRDGFVPNIENNPKLTTSETTKLVPLAEAISSLPQRQNAGIPNRKTLSKSAALVKDRLTNGDIIETMYIMAAVDIKLNKLEKREEYDATIDQQNERISYHQQVLCALELHQNGVLEVTPGFSIDEIKDNNPFLLAPPLDTDPAHRITTFTFTSTEGSVFEYSILNEFATSNLEAEENLSKQHIHDNAKLYERQGKLFKIGSRLLQSANRKLDKHTIHGFVEIVSASVLEFEESPICCKCHLSIPTGWGVSSNEVGTSYEVTSSAAVEIIPLDNRRGPFTTLNESFETSAAFFLIVILLQMVSRINSALKIINSSSGDASFDAYHGM